MKDVLGENPELTAGADVAFFTDSGARPIEADGSYGPLFWDKVPVWLVAVEGDYCLPKFGAFSTDSIAPEQCTTYVVVDASTGDELVSF